MDFDHFSKMINQACRNEAPRLVLCLLPLGWGLRGWELERKARLCFRAQAGEEGAAAGTACTRHGFR